jgi:CRP/FNR family transcriptional regulator, cyclic AMP receptor protein
MPAVEDLERQPIFAGLSHDQVEVLAKYAEEKDVAAGTELTHEGRYEGGVVVVISGSVGIERDGRRVDTVGPGEVFGEIAAIDGGPRTATTRALEDSHVVVVSPRQFNEVLDEAPELRTTVLSTMESRLERIDADADAGA